MRAWLDWQRESYAIWREQAAERVLMAIAWRLPRDLVMWCAIRLIAHGTTGQYGTTHPDELSVKEALKRWKPS